MPLGWSRGSWRAAGREAVIEGQIDGFWGASGTNGVVFECVKHGFLVILKHRSLHFPIIP